jgi:putative DNA primase/helicase
LRRANGEAWVQLLQRAAGASLFGRNGSAKLDDSVMVLKGPAGCGKSTFGECLNAVAGTYGKALNGSLLFGRGNSEFQLAAIQGYRLLVLSEPKSTQRELDVEMLKALSGGDERTGRHPYGKDEITFSPDATLWLMSNHPIEVDDDAVWRRLRFFEFVAALDFTGDKGDPRIRQALKGDPVELACALAWFLEGARLFDAEGWGDTATWATATTDERSAHDGLTRFITEQVTITGVVTDELAEAALMANLRMWQAMTPDAMVTETPARAKDGLVQRIERAGGSFDRRKRVYRGCHL